MKALLNKDVSGLGRKGDVVNVKGGYFRNYLLPRGIANFATKADLAWAQEREETRLAEKEKLLEKADEVMEALADVVVKIARKGSKKGSYYAAITEKDVVNALLADHKINLDEDFVKMSHLKEVGEHEVDVVLAPGKTTKLKLQLELADE